MTPTDEHIRAQISHLLRATGLPVSEEPTFQAAFERARQSCADARDALASAAEAMAEDQAQNRAASLAVEMAVRASVEELSWLKSQARALWVDMKPSQRAPLSEEEVQRRQGLFHRIFPHTPSDLLHLSAARALERLGAIRDQVVTSPELGSLGADFGLSVLKLEEATQARAAEARDDADLLANLQQARQRAQQQYSAARLLLEGILRADDSAEEVEGFLLRRAPSKASESGAAAVPVDTSA